MKSLLIGCFVAIAVVFAQQTAQAQTSDAGSAGQAVPTAAEIQDLTSKLTPEELNALAGLLQAFAAEREAGEKDSDTSEQALLADLTRTWDGYRKFVLDNITGFGTMTSGVFRSIAAMFGGRGVIGNLLFALVAVASVAAGVGAEWLAIRAVRPWVRSRLQRVEEDQSLADLMRFLGSRLAGDLLGIIAFSLVALLVSRLFLPDQNDRLIIQNLILIAVLPARIVEIFLTLMLAPSKPELRLVTTDDWTARFVWRHTILLATVVGVALFLFWSMEFHQIPGGAPFRFWIGIYVYASIIYVIWRARKGLTEIIKGQDEQITTGLERMAVWWPTIAIVVIVLQYFAAQISNSTGTLQVPTAVAPLTLAIIVMTPFLDTILRGAIKHLMPPMRGEGAVAEAAYHQTRHSYWRIGRVILLALLIVIVGKMWGINLHDIASTGLGAQLGAKVLGAVIVLAFGYLVWETANLLINRQLATDQPASPAAEQIDGEPAGVGKSRKATVLPIVRVALQVAIVTLTVLVALGHLGVNITPLLAGAGVFGLAIGFGAQTLVKDVVSGIFFLLDDAFRVGEYVDIGGTAGTVEKISIRSLQLRHPNGPVHIIPYGAIPKLTNNSRDYVIMKLRFTVPFDTDIDKVRKIFKKIGAELMESPALAEGIIAPFKSQGVADVDDVGIVVRGKFTAKPGAQWLIRKEVYSRVQKAFEENGIQFARREVRVQIPGLDDSEELNHEQKLAIEKAAGTAAAAAEGKPRRRTRKTA
jgi:moderate conductance mechanosensitive channel